MNAEHFSSPEFEDPLSNYDPPKYADGLAETLSETAVSAMWLIPFAEVSPEATIQQAVQALAGLGVSSLLVMEHGRLIGIVTERDILARVADQYDALRNQPVRSVMTANPVVVYEDSPCASALSAIAASGYRHVPVLDAQDRVVGMASPRRVFQFLQKQLVHC
jgi:CBS domain-containing protein